MQIGEFELMVQLDLEECISGKSLATIGHFKPTGDVLAKLQQRIDTDIDTLYRIVQELPGDRLVLQGTKPMLLGDLM